jgi:hypothetical protein
MSTSRIHVNNEESLKFPAAEEKAENPVFPVGTGFSYFIQKNISGERV